MKIKILPAALDDLKAGKDFYEKQTSGVGTYFIDTLISDIDSLVITAGVHPQNEGGYYRMLSKRFPFAIYYRVESNTAFVYAVLDCRRKPAWLKKRLES